MGENGAGKSTLMKIVAGLIASDGGEMLWRGQAVRFQNPAEAAANGIAMVHQESLLAPHLSVAENIFLGREESAGFGFVRRRRMTERAAQLIAEHGFPLQADWRVDRLSPAGKQLVEICRALQHGSSLLIFDEPTSSLSDAETREVFRIVARLKERQLGVILHHPPPGRTAVDRRPRHGAARRCHGPQRSAGGTDAGATDPSHGGSRGERDLSSRAGGAGRGTAACHGPYAKAAAGGYRLQATRR